MSCHIILTKQTAGNVRTYQLPMNRCANSMQEKMKTNELAHEYKMYRGRLLLKETNYKNINL